MDALQPLQVYTLYHLYGQPRRKACHKHSRLLNVQRMLIATTITARTDKDNQVEQQTFNALIVQ